MAQFVIEREIKGAGSLSEEQLREVSLRSLETLNEMGPRIQWLHSYVTEDKVYASTSLQTKAAYRSMPGAFGSRRTGFPPCAVSLTLSM